MAAVIDCQLGHAATAAAECPPLDLELSKRVIGAYELRISEFGAQCVFRGMRVEITITVLWTSLLGTFAKCRPALKMSVYRGWSQPVDATLYLNGEMECALM